MIRGSNAEWAHVAPRIPPAKPGGNKRTVDIREVLNGVMYVLSTGCQWRALRTLAWLNRCRRLAKDWENLNRIALAFLRLAAIRLMLRKLCNPI